MYEGFVLEDFLALGGVGVWLWTFISKVWGIGKSDSFDMDQSNSEGPCVYLVIWGEFLREIWKLFSKHVRGLYPKTLKHYGWRVGLMTCCISFFRLLNWWCLSITDMSSSSPMVNSSGLWGDGISIFEVFTTHSTCSNFRQQYRCQPRSMFDLLSDQYSSN